MPSRHAPYAPACHASAFAAPFVIRPRTLGAARSPCFRTKSTSVAVKVARRYPIACTLPNVDSKLPMSTRIGVVATSVAKAEAQTTTTTEAPSRGLFGMKARAYWESIGLLPLVFAGTGIFVLFIKMLKVMRGQWKSTDGVNRATTPDSVIVSPEMERELHVFKCGGCGYEMYPARGREFKFFPDSFKCPLCASPKSQFWDLNDPTDPRNQEDDDEDDDLQPAGIQDIENNNDNTPRAQQDEPKTDAAR